MGEGLRLVALVAAIAAPTFARAEETFALRAGWAYGIGAEVEYRPGAWGLGLSGGHAPGYGTGGYVGLQWGARPLGDGGLVAEGGIFRGVPNPFREAPAGLGAYALGGYAAVPVSPLSVRFVAGGGVPFATSPRFPTFELLAKLTAGVIF